MLDLAVSRSTSPLNKTQYVTGWKSEPDSRGTWTLLYSCLFTLFLCVYSAIHINIPARGDSGNAQFWRKVKWVVVAILAPEIVLYSAWQQYHLASSFCAELYNVRLEQAGLPPLSTKLLWQKLTSISGWLELLRKSRAPSEKST
ncbi:uncharacterized protein PV07_07198 [Cladophialophora immunda]|uniref:Uncharacterized protein n=1 Tax=Cladophialophora immunda TaxID=569365 RepID=A0A0D2CUY4_9EURO|nr:uncharacterized protein PV07_07198 [Cladophialophora immunda]KIW27464.1 hypothetical protein PV07_07198 [Cladophialophora immunda]